MNIKGKLTTKYAGIPAILIIVALLAGAGIASAALLSEYGTIEGDANVKQSVLVDGNNHTVTNEYDIGDSPAIAGNTYDNHHYLKNRADIPATIQFETEYTSSKYSWWKDSEPGITTTYLEYFDDAGAEISDYEELTASHTTAEIKHTILEDDVIDEDDADPGDTIVFPEGTYTNFTIEVENIVIASTTKGGAIIDAEGDDFGIDIENMLGNITIKGFTVKNWSACGINQGMSAREGTAVHVLNNIVEVPEGGPSQYGNSIQVSGDGSTVAGNEVEATGYSFEEEYWDTCGILVIGASDTVVENNYVEYVGEGVSMLHNGIAVASVSSWGLSPAKNNLVKNNTVTGVDRGISIQGSAVDTTIKYNVIKNNGIGIHSIAFGGGEPAGTEAHFNNLINDETDLYNDGDDTVNAYNNWWGTDGIDTSGSVAASYKDKGDGTVTLEPGERDEFVIRTKLAINLVPDNYTVKTTVIPGPGVETPA